MSDDAVRAALEELSQAHDLSREQARALFTAIMSGAATEAQIGGVLMALRVKGEVDDELTGAVEAMRDLSTRVAVTAPYLVDTCGTGGSGGASCSTCPPPRHSSLRQRARTSPNTATGA